MSNEFAVAGSDLVGEAGGLATPPASTQTTSSPPSNTNSVQNQQQQQQQQFLFRRLKMVSDQNDKMFDSRKKAIVSDLTKPQYCDLSPKGSVDLGCQPLMKVLNDHEDYVTTSSCSGRISIFHMATARKQNLGEENNSNKKNDDDEEKNTNTASSSSSSTKRGEADVATGWVFISHDRVEEDDSTVLSSIANFCNKFQIDMKIDQDKWNTLASTFSSNSNKNSNNTDEEKTTKAEKAASTLDAAALGKDIISNYSHQLTFCVEPFVMHVSCRNEVAAQNLLQAAVQAGYRNSGAVLAGGELLSESALTSSKKKGKGNNNDNNDKNNNDDEQQQNRAVDKSPLGNSKIAEPPSKITVAIRHTSSIAVPLVFSSSDKTFGGESFVTTDYVKALVSKGNLMMKENEERIRRLENEVKKRLLLASSSSSQKK